jgi:hypothetical protein
LPYPSNPHKEVSIHGETPAEFFIEI